MNISKKYILKNIYNILIISLAFLVIFCNFLPLSAQEKQFDDEIIELASPYLMTLNLLKNEFIFSQDINFENLIKESLQSLILSLDEPYSHYIDAQTLQRQKDNFFSGHFGGIGISTIFKDNQLTVVSVIDNGPAWKAGILAEDIIVEIDSQKTDNLTQNDVSNLIRGEVGSTVNLTISRDGLQDELLITVLRGDIKASTIEKKVLFKETNGQQETDIPLGYIKIISFNTNTPTEYREAMEYFSQDNIAGLIIDLRNNTGGLLEPATQLASFLIPSGTIVYIKNREGTFFTVSAKRNNYPLKPLVILVNKYTASAAEILASAIQYHKRGVLIGTRTFGKGLIQHIYDLPDGSGISLSTAEYYSAGKLPIDKIGIEPDIFLEKREDAKEDEQLNYAISYIFNNIDKLNANLKLLPRNNFFDNEISSETDD